ncbi:MAG TPA: DUF6600 domain-containing protein [Candidatus Polarisedimenticolia bacterium]|jgi:hypothetical protein|nr:DUF6600 domain-containing protein [Candidatus Polarisedimenticolia bacterium]
MKTMRVSSVLAILIFSALASACVTVAPQRVEVQPAPRRVAVPIGAEEQPFYDDLSLYGEWIYVSGPGWVWCPSETEAGWRPYQLGHWVLTDYGWTWASDEEFGWAVYHYGRWHSDPAYGWVWVPGTEWGPAWVAWHQGGDWIGWAPLPWQVRWRAGIGLDWGSVRIDVALAPSSWYFVRTRYLVDPGLRFRIASPDQNVTLIRLTQHVTNYTYVDNRIVDQSIRADFVGRAVGRPIRRYPLREAESPEMSSGGGVRDGEFVVYRPGMARGGRPPGRSLPPGQERRRFPAPGRPEPIQENASAPAGRSAGEAREAARTGRDQRPSRIDRAAPGQERREPGASSPSTEPATPRTAPRGRDDAGARPGGGRPESPGNPPAPSSAAPRPSKPENASGKSERGHDHPQPGKGRGKKHDPTGKSGKPKPADAGAAQPDPEKSDSEKPE